LEEDFYLNAPRGESRKEELKQCMDSPSKLFLKFLKNYDGNIIYINKIN
jgi:hypothetical protein